MHPDCVAFPHRCNLHLLSAVSFKDLLDGCRGARGLVFLLRMMFLDNISAIALGHRRRQRPDGFEEQVHAYREIRSIEKRRLALLHQFAHFFQMLLPSRSAHNHGDACLRAADNIGNHGKRRGEVDHHINLAKEFRRQAPSILVVLAGQRAHFMPALRGYLSHQRAGLAASQHQQFHANTSGSTSEKKTLWRRETTLGTSASSTTKLMLISDAPWEIM